MNNRWFFLVVICLLIPAGGIVAQNIVSGRVVGPDSSPVQGASISIKGTQIGVATDESGQFELSIPGSDSVTLLVQHISYKRIEVRILPSSSSIKIELEVKNQFLNTVEVTGDQSKEKAGLVRINTRAIDALPGASADITGLLKTIPGVVSNNELSNNYQVRGGNFDENLIYVNDIPVYRPFLITNGQQEGLSFLNPQFVRNLEFSSGGWGAQFGGKLSSVLNVEYKSVNTKSIDLEGGLLGGNLGIELGNARNSLMLGVRRKSSRYLFNTLETQGQYLPVFTDIQLAYNARFSNNSSLSVIGTYARNRYLVEPESRVTEFGTFSNSFRLFVGFEGTELMNYDTWQLGGRYIKNFSDTWTMKVVLSSVRTDELEFRNIEGGYRLCDIDRVNDRDNDCVQTRGIGTSFDYSRNRLLADLVDGRLLSEHELTENQILTWGLEWKYIHLNDNLLEYTFLDSADYVIEVESLDSKQEISHSIATAFVGHEIDLGALQLESGLRVVIPQLTGEVLISPRINASWRASDDLVWKVAAGIYRQPPFYREFRDFEGELNRNIKSQSAFHLLAGFTKDKIIWGRPFQISSEVYFKHLWNVVAYDIDNVRIRYYSNNDTRARVLGADFRMAGEFIPGTESWFSLGVLKASENPDFDSRGWIRRPSDQRLTAAILFQDYFPNNPSMRVALNFQFGSGLPFGPPGDIDNRNVFTGGIYRRVDIGFTKEFEPKFGNLYLTAEILNMLGADNVITYTWIRDLANDQIAVPNSLSNRFFNLKLRIRI